MKDLKRTGNRATFCVELAKHISEVTESEISPIKVSENLLLMELGMEPIDKLIGKYLKETTVNE